MDLWGNNTALFTQDTVLVAGTDVRCRNDLTGGQRPIIEVILTGGGGDGEVDPSPSGSPRGHGGSGAGGVGQLLMVRGLALL